MHFRALALLFLLFSGLTFANGRSPAVEDFVGIEVDQPRTVPHGAESLYNLEKDIVKIGAVRNDAPVAPAPISETAAPQTTDMNMTAYLAVALLLGLPVFTLLLVMHHMRQRASQESASNIEVLAKYRRERELAKQKQEEARKAS